MKGWLAATRLQARIASGHVWTTAWNAARWLANPFRHSAGIRRLRRNFGQRLRPEPQRKVEILYAAFARCHPQASVVQIGANDGLMEDPLRAVVMASDWRGIFVEPVPDLYEQLCANYAGRPGLIFENCAIAPQDGSMPFYYLRDAGQDAALPHWYRGLGSFSRDVILKHASEIPGLEDLLVEREVPCLSFDSLCRRHGFETIDVLHIDTEGYDYEILKSIDLNRYRPRLLAYEIHHLSPADRDACWGYLEHHGYAQLEEGLDAICINQRDRSAVDEEVHAIWRVLSAARGVPA